MVDQLAFLEQQIGIMFRDRKLLQTAFMHRSLFNEQPHLLRDLTDNERLEFLGDAVLQFITTTWLFANYADRSEATLTSWRSALVSTKGLAAIAARLDLGQYAYLSRGEDTPTGRKRPSLLADLFEALIGAIYLDQGLEAARNFVEPFLRDRIETVQQIVTDPTTRLQEKIQARYKQLPVYRLVEARGPAHQREYVMAVQVEGREFTGIGPSKKEARKAAARAALTELENAT
ncbi:MAG: ribonuclease III [Chloroflexus sp.]